MIPNAYITDWRKEAPWPSDAQVEQDLVISWALVALFSDSVLKEHLGLRGGTALHNLYLNPAVRYSEDIDCFYRFMESSQVSVTRMEFEENLTLKIHDRGFNADVRALLRPGFHYNPQIAFEYVMENLISKLD